MESELSKIDNKVAVGLADNDTIVSEDETNHVVNHLKKAERYTLQNTKHPIETIDVISLSEIIKKYIS